MKATFSPGEYFLGDICYVLNSRVYDDVWGTKNGYSDGVFVVPTTKEVFAVSGTAYGDGSYYDNFGNQFPVDAGVIGIVPKSLWKDVKEIRTDLGLFFTIATELSFEAEDGVFKIVADGVEHTIDTLNDGEDDDTYEEDEEDDEVDE